MNISADLGGNGSASPDRKASGRLDSEQSRPWANVARQQLNLIMRDKPRYAKAARQALAELDALDAAWAENERCQGSAATLARLQAEYLALVGLG